MGFDTGTADYIDTSSGLGLATLGQYIHGGSDNEDTLRWQSATVEAIPEQAKRRGWSKENTQIHEIIHRATHQSGYRDARSSKLNKRLPKKVKK